MAADDVGAALAPLTERGFQVFHHLHVLRSRAAIDHVVIGPSGIFVIDEKSWTGEVEVSRYGLRRNGRPRDEALEKVNLGAGAVATTVERALRSRPRVWAVLCFVGDARVEPPTTCDSVRVINLDLLVPFIEQAPTRLDPVCVEIAAGALQRVFVS